LSEVNPGIKYKHGSVLNSVVSDDAASDRKEEEQQRQAPRKCNFHNESAAFMDDPN